MDKQKLITLAEEVGFKSKFFSAQPYKYSHKEEMRWYLWMCEFNEFLLNKQHTSLGMTYNIENNSQFLYDMLVNNFLR